MSVLSCLKPVCLKFGRAKKTESQNGSSTSLNRFMLESRPSPVESNGNGSKTISPTSSHQSIDQFIWASRSEIICHASDIKQLLKNIQKRGYPINTPDASDMTPLLMVLAQGKKAKLKNVNTLITHGADPCLEKGRSTPLLYALTQGCNQKIIAKLLSRHNLVIHERHLKAFREAMLAHPDKQYAIDSVQTFNQFIQKASV